MASMLPQRCFDQRLLIRHQMRTSDCESCGLECGSNGRPGEIRALTAGT
jgi:hypothetical protein